MKKVRVYEAAREFKISSDALLEIIRSLGAFIVDWNLYFLPMEPEYSHTHRLKSTTRGNASHVSLIIERVKPAMKQKLPILLVSRGRS